MPTLLSTHAPQVLSLPPTYFEPTAYGGIVLLIGSALIGGFYPLAQAHDWMRINSARTTHEARVSYYFSLPLVLAFIAAATFLGMIGATEGLNTKGDTLLFQLFDKFLPSGFRGLAYAGILAVVMSSVNSIMLGGAATVHSLFGLAGSEKAKVKQLRIIVAVFGGLSAIGAGLYPRLVELTVLASFTSLCLGPMIIFGLFSSKQSDMKGALSIALGILGLFASLPFFGLTAFVCGLICSLIPFVLWKRAPFYQS